MYFCISKIINHPLKFTVKMIKEICDSDVTSALVGRRVKVAPLAPGRYFDGTITAIHVRRLRSNLFNRVVSVQFDKPIRAGFGDDNSPWHFSVRAPFNSGLFLID
jgi:hypothetical protein